MPWFPSFLICREAQKVRDLLKGTERGKKRAGKASIKKEQSQSPGRRQNREGAEVESFCFSGPWFSSFGLRKADLVEWLGEQMPFIDLSSITSDRLGQSSPMSWLPASLSWELVTHPQGRRVFWAGVADRARTKNPELGSGRGSG